VEELLRKIEQLSEIEQCELLEAIILRTRSREQILEEADRIRAKLPKRSERVIKRDADTAIREVRREFARESHR
jgi:hypothetical protein